MSDSLALYEVQHGIAVITINRSDKRNALSRGLIDALAEGLSAAKLAGSPFDAIGTPAAWLACRLFAGFRFSDHSIPTTEKADVNRRNHG